MENANEEILSLRRPSVLPKEVKALITQCIETACNSDSAIDLGIRLAATFDLMVSAAYYNFISNRGWTYCNSFPQKMFYTYTNVCPRCIGHSKFMFAKANKPESGKIGQITAEILCLFYQHIFSRNGHRIDVYKGSEPIDVIINDTERDMFLLAEVKAAPLLTLPIAAECDRMTENTDGEIVFSEHQPTDNPSLKLTRMSIYIPKYENAEERFFPLDIDWNNPHKYYEAICSLIKGGSDFFNSYLNFWHRSFEAYKNKERDLSAYWLTNACGTPSPIPERWPKRRNSGGYESVSDSKTSAGMDRTDDIKKGIYQVVKLGAEYKTRFPNVRTAIISNLPAVRHFDEYLLTIKDIVWAISKEPHAATLGDLPPHTPIYNLFDGIITLTESHVRDIWVKQILSHE